MTDRPALATTGELAAALGADLAGPPDLPISGIETLGGAGRGDLAFIRSAKFASEWSGSKASAALVTRGIEVPGHDPTARALLMVDDADRAMLELLKVAQARLAPPRPAPGVHPTAIVGEDAEIAPSASIGPYAVIGAGAAIGEQVLVGAHAFIDEGVRVGDGTTLHPRVTLLRGTAVGRGCEFFPGVVIGGDGFGFLPGPQGPLKVPHVGGVRIGDQVEVGSCTSIDRGKFSDTVIGDATKIDNQVQIGHACKIGRGVIICGCCGIGGSVAIGDGAILGGHVAVADNIEIPAGSRVGGGSAVDQSVTADEPWFGWPARPVSVSMRAITASWKLPQYRQTLRELKKRVDALEGPTK
ncbi:MAG: UDP-3-O-(3-hydroxymyristoyl)glucosamine N-acyltransferase [Phycisphaeraceae bacterium]|nr:MAG: UDP-3-O-(3-hydroxymyristoyl)glucosamine N-acyltransferase [Phycisphaeraceae bacterium]